MLCSTMTSHSLVASYYKTIKETRQCLDRVNSQGWTEDKSPAEAVKETELDKYLVEATWTAAPHV